MKERLLKLLACPVCGGGIVLVRAKDREDGEILDGVLCCDRCEREFRIVRGVPRFTELDEIEKEKASTAENFGWQWKRFTQEDEKYGSQFLGWLQPVRQKFFKDRVVLEGGCGKGRHTKLASEWGAKEVVGVDLSAAVETAFAATRDMANVHIIQADILNLPLKKVFDYAFSVGVLHHTPDPTAAFTSLAAKVREGGSLSAWVYGEENNRWIVRLVNPLRRRFTSRISQPLLYHLSKAPTAGVFLASKLIYRPCNRLLPGIAAKLFYNDYLNHLASFGWREQHNIVFDHLVAPTAFYISKGEFERWWEGIGAEDVEITWHNRNSWCGFGKVSSTAEAQRRRVLED